MHSGSILCLLSLRLKLSNVSKLTVRVVLSFKEWRNHPVDSLPVYGHILSNKVLKSKYALVSKILPETVICCCRNIQSTLTQTVCSGAVILFS